jgi:hypothetical protein
MSNSPTSGPRTRARAQAERTSDETDVELETQPRHEPFLSDDDVGSPRAPRDEDPAETTEIAEDPLGSAAAVELGVDNTDGSPDNFSEAKADQPFSAFDPSAPRPGAGGNDSNHDQLMGVRDLSLGTESGGVGTNQSQNSVYLRLCRNAV